MNPLFLRLQGALNHISYTLRLQVICTLGCVFVAYVLISMFYAQFPVIKSLKTRQVGLHQHQALNALLKTCCQAELLAAQHGDKKEIEQLLTQMENQLFVIENTLAARMLDSSLLISGDPTLLAPLVKTISTQLVAIKDGWEDTSTLPIDATAQFVQSLISLMHYNFHVYRLDYAVELQDFLIADIGVIHIPTMQSLIAEITTRSNLESGSAQVLLQLFESLQRENKTVHSQISAIVSDKSDLSNEEHSAILLLYNSYNEAVSHFMTRIKEVSLTSINSAESALQLGWKFNDTISNFLDVHISHHIHVVYRRLGIATGCVLVLLAMFCVMYFTRTIHAPLDNLKMAVNAMIEGHRSTRVPITSNDEIGDLTHVFNHLAALWDQSVVMMEDTSQKLQKKIDAVIENGQHLKKNLQQQTSIISNLESTTSEVTNHARPLEISINDSTRNFESVYALTYHHMMNLVEKKSSMYLLANHIEKVVNIVSSIKVQMDEVNNLVSTIITIADQGNLLSLNTAIRAGRSGEHGKGVAVVADNVSELAGQTAFAALNIEHGVQEIHSAIALLAADVDQFASQVASHANEENAFNDSLKKHLEDTQQQMLIFNRISIDLRDQLKEISTLHAGLLEFSEAKRKSDVALPKLNNTALTFRSHMQTYKVSNNGEAM